MIVRDSFIVVTLLLAWKSLIDTPDVTVKHTRVEDYPFEKASFLDAPTHLYKSGCVRRSVGLSITLSLKLRKTA